MKSCDVAIEKMQAALDAEDRAAGVAMLDSHLDDCPECSDMWYAMQRVEEMLHEAPMVSAPAHLALTIMNQVRAECAHPNVARRVSPWPLILVAGIGTMLLGWWGMILAGSIPVIRSNEFGVISGGVRILVDGVAMLARSVVSVLGVTSPALQLVGFAIGLSALLVFTLGVATSVRRAALRM